MSILLVGCSGISGIRAINNICPVVLVPTEIQEDILAELLPVFYIAFAEQQRKLYICRYGVDP